jgi:hypothetical protein
LHNGYAKVSEQQIPRPATGIEYREAYGQAYDGECERFAGTEAPTYYQSPEPQAHPYHNGVHHDSPSNGMV